MGARLCTETIIRIAETVARTGIRNKTGFTSENKSSAEFDVGETDWDVYVRYISSSNGGNLFGATTSSNILDNVSAHVIVDKDGIDVEWLKLSAKRAVAGAIATIQESVELDNFLKRNGLSDSGIDTPVALVNALVFAIELYLTPELLSTYVSATGLPEIGTYTVSISKEIPHGLVYYSTESTQNAIVAAVATSLLDCVAADSRTSLIATSVANTLRSATNRETFAIVVGAAIVITVVITGITGVVVSK